MALKKSELYSSLWASCDELRGGMDASQYKDYVLVLLFVKYVSDRYAGQPYAAITIPKGASFADMVALKGKSDIGDQINKKILGPLAQANHLSDMPDFDDPARLGSGKEKIERLTNLVAIFENPALDFSKNRADGDDLLGDAYEYLMRHFATESGKSKGQFYTPAEVSRVIAKVIGMRHAKATAHTTVYDPTCGSGSLLLKVGDEAAHGRPDGQRLRVTLYGQEKDNATAGLARMNMILHDYAELLHIVRSLRSTGKGACILPHGVLFRGNAEAAIRRNLVQRGYIKGIIGLPEDTQDIDAHLRGEIPHPDIEALGHYWQVIPAVRAAVLLFHPDPERFTTGAFVKIGFFRTESDLLYHDEVRGDLFTQTRQTMDLLLTKYLKSAISYRGIHRVETLPVPEAALREAVLNAIIHKDYASHSPAQIRVYADKLKIWNPGVLPENWSVENLHGTDSRHYPDNYPDDCPDNYPDDCPADSRRAALALFREPAGHRPGTR